MEASPAWARCNSCKGDIDFDQVYFVCSVSTCNRKGTELRFCSVECWDAHVPVMRHREAWAEEKRSPSQTQWEREHPPADEDAGDFAPAEPSTAASPQSRPASAPLNETDLPHDILIVVSKLKAYVRARSGMNTSDAVMNVLSDRVRALCDEGMRHAAAAGRRTLMDRDFK